jgi:carboxymethylenebutenolidase
MKISWTFSLPRGACPVELFGAPAAATAPVVLLFTDVFGPRPASFAIAEEIAALGCRVLVPQLFYDHLPFAPPDPVAMFKGDPAERQRVMGMFNALDQARIDGDVNALLEQAAQRLGAQAPIGALGYCMGGRYALTAASASPRVLAVATIHGSRLAPANGPGPHERLQGVKARIYVGVAATDPTFDAAEEGRLASALRAAGIDHMIETYAGTVHGFALADVPVHHPQAAARHRARLVELFAGLRA